MNQRSFDEITYKASWWILGSILSLLLITSFILTIFFWG